MARRISSSRPITGSSFPARAKVGQVARVAIERRLRFVTALLRWVRRPSLSVHAVSSSNGASASNSFLASGVRWRGSMTWAVAY